MRAALLRSAALVLCALTLMTVAGTAHAQSISLNQALFDRRQPRRVTQQQPNYINRADCLARDELTFLPFLTGYTTSMFLQVWAASGTTDCTQVANRQFGGSAQ